MAKTDVSAIASKDPRPAHGHMNELRSDSSEPVTSTWVQLLPQWSLEMTVVPKHLYCSLVRELEVPFLPAAEPHLCSCPIAKVRCKHVLSSAATFGVIFR